MKITLKRIEINKLGCTGCVFRIDDSSCPGADIELFRCVIKGKNYI